ncbi:tetratricopeptide repeat protein [Bernardetia litoralis DSM 6794]|uniref:Tetratricopeptide repeat protein n=1 Tax=Bernardetia litoralis (strain ATCC 23117 / DSM 6794 / NBRC 15988 / NCIMB 1366 / Fx l1 / Sio-4) TaxID=880071 RepID=I4ALH1_BERLS|nr:tetratricopeptide repeat protein [Bernardetia litoralis]AFM04806.1 tetratricopeptide repeat protein [Bernardetia litoralis DSM 6794]
MKQDNKILDKLFAQLQIAPSTPRIEAILTQIQNIWLNTENVEMNTLVRLGTESLSKGDYTDAINVFTQVVDKNPSFAEGWNKRATAFYLRGNYKAAIDDIQQTLDLENRHFGALAGLATIYSEIGDEYGVLGTLEKLYHIHPFQPKLKDQIEELRSRLN